MIFQPVAYSQITNDALNYRWLKKKPIIRNIEVDGNQFFSDSKIKKVMFSRETNIFRAIKSDRRRRIQKETIIRDTSEIKYLYLSNGFLGMKLEETFAPILPDSNALVKLSIHEGRRFVYGNIAIEGEMSPKFQWQLNSIISKFKPLKPVDPFKLRQAVYDCKSYLANNGYPYSQVTYKLDTNLSDTLAVIIYTITLDSIVHFGDLGIIGAAHYDSSQVKRELTFGSGDLYSRRALIESQKRLLSTGNYLTLQMNNNEADTLNAKSRLNPQFTINLKEKRPHYVSIKTGAGQDPYKDLIWDFSAAWGKRNIFRSRRLEFSAGSSFVIFTEWRIISHRYKVKFTEPWFLGIRMPMILTGTFEPGVRSKVQLYRIETWSISLETYKELENRMKAIAGLEYKSANIYGLSFADAIKLRQDKGISIRQKLYGNLNRDSRDHPFIPTGGSLTTMSGEFAGGFMGGDESYYSLGASWSRYQRVWPGWLSASRLKGGYVKEFGTSESVPIDVRHYAGGANSIRGFAENALGPQSSDGTPEGGSILLIGNQELRFPIVGKFWGSLFADGGNVYKNWNDIKWSNLAFSIGGGIQFISPAGPIRLDYAHRIKTEAAEPGYHFHFTILYAF
jgi:outer membrane protein insertion porin family